MVNSKTTFHIQRSTFKLFWKKDKKTKADSKTPKEFKGVGTEKDGETDSRHTDMSKFPRPRQGEAGGGRNFEFGVLKSFYISEKSTMLNPFRQYVFKVFDNTTKNEIKKQVERSFDVKVKGVKIINLPKKKRNVGRHAGFKKGFKKAIVVLEKGYNIEQTKA